MNLIKVESKGDLKAVLKNARNPTIVVLASDVIRREDFKKSIPVIDYSSIIIPTVEILNEYLDNGISEVYEKKYYEQLQKPNRLFLINELIYLMLMSGKDILIVTAADEIEYQYLKMFSRFVNIVYNYKMISAEKYLKGKDSKLNFDELTDKTSELRTTLGNKLADSGYVLYELLSIVITKSSLNLFPKEIQRKIKNIWEGEL